MMYKHALFLNPYIESSTTSFMKLFPPTGLEYVATSAKSYCGKITLLDLRYENELCETKKLLDFISSEGIDIICANIGWNRQYDEIKALLNQMPENIPLVVGGYKATLEADELIESCPKIDILVRGEGEETIKEILKNEPLENILGISYRKDGRVVHNGHRPLEDINTIPPPDRSLRRYKYYMASNGINVTSLAFDTVLSSRGCPYNCKFCTFSLNPLGQKRAYATRSVESVVNEIEGIEASAVLFSDDNFFHNVKRAEAICDLIIKRGIKKRFVAQSRIETAKHPSLMDKAVKAGFKMLLIGVESPHDRVLEQFDKGFTQDTIRKCFDTFRKYPMYYHGYFIYGNIGETEEEMLYISQFSKEIGLDSITFHKLRIEKFSELEDLAKRTPGYHVTKKGELYSDKFSHADLKKIGRRIKFSFYTPARLLRIFFKLIRIKFFNAKELLSFFIASPRLLNNLIVREVKKGRLKDTLKRVFINSTKSFMKNHRFS